VKRNRERKRTQKGKGERKRGGEGKSERGRRGGWEEGRRGFERQLSASAPVTSPLLKKKQNWYHFQEVSNCFLVLS
jgi:hypothetical protein